MTVSIAMGRITCGCFARQDFTLDAELANTTVSPERTGHTFRL